MENVTVEVTGAPCCSNCKKQFFGLKPVSPGEYNPLSAPLICIDCVNKLNEEIKSSDDMVQFILDIDWMSTKEFCQKYGVPEPYFTGEVKSSADQFLQIDAVKHRLFVQKAKELRKAKGA